MNNRQIAAALQSLRPGAKWALNGDDYANLEWLDQVQTKPTEGEVTALAPTAEATVNLAASRADAITQLLTDSSGNAKFVRAVLLVILDEVNIIRALLPGPPAARTATQFKTAVQTKINSGAAD